MLLVRDFLKDMIICRSPGEPEHPLVSVILSTFARYECGLLNRAVESILSQTFKDYEVIIVDDGSVDGTAQFIDQLRLADPRIIHIRHAQNSGLPALRLNEGFIHARGKYVINQFDDDRWEPSALERLVSVAESSREESVVVGKANFYDSHRPEEPSYRTLPCQTVNAISLSHGPQFANNSVLIPREFLDRFGMYDCHIGSRRLYDWDLWLRLIKHIPFVVLDELVGHVYENNVGSIGMTVPWDLELFRFIGGISRDHLLTPAAWENYQVDSLQIANVDLQGALGQRLYENHLIDYYLRFRHTFPQIEGFIPTVPEPMRVALFTKQHYDVTDEVCFQHYEMPEHSRAQFKTYFQPLDQVRSTWSKENDLLMLSRVVEPKGEQILNQAQASGLVTAYHLDDDYFTMHELGEDFAHLAPATRNYKTMTRLVSNVDAVWTTTKSIANSVSPHNARVIPHNNCIPVEWLPSLLPARRSKSQLRIGCTSRRRHDELELIWPAFQGLAREFPGKLEFEFWGTDISDLPCLDAPVRYIPYTFSYFEYLQRLRQNEFDILMTPLLDHPKPRLATSLIKYYECAVAGALGVFSNVPQFEAIISGETCLKAANTVEAWVEVLRNAITMAPAEFNQLREACLEEVREKYSNYGQIQQHEAAWRATEFHFLTREKRHCDGRPRIVFAFHREYLGGAEMQLLRRMNLMRQYGIEPIAVFPDYCRTRQQAECISEVVRQGIQIEFLSYTYFTTPRSPRQFTSVVELDDVVSFLDRVKPALVHSTTFIPTIGQACQELRIAHVASLYQPHDGEISEQVSQDTGIAHCQVVHSDSIRYMRIWRNALGVEGYCSRNTVPETLFDLGRHRLDRLKKSDEPVLPVGTRSRKLRLALVGTLERRKGQLEAINAVGTLTREGLDVSLDIFGHTHFIPDYVQACQYQISSDRNTEAVRMHGFDPDISKILASTDVLLCASTSESFPGSICEAMASGVLVVTTPVGGVGELIIDGVTGVLCKGFSRSDILDGIRRATALSREKVINILNQARRVALVECHPQRAANDLFTMYVHALRTRQNDTEPSSGRPLIGCN